MNPKKHGKPRMIMPNPPPNQSVYIAAQQDMFRLAKRDHGLSARRLSLDSGFSEVTIRSWAKGAAMPAWALAHLSKSLPDELTSMMFDINDKFVGTDEGDDGDLDTLAEQGLEYNVEHLNARRPSSENGTGLSPREKSRLRERARRLAGTARRAARAA